VPPIPPGQQSPHPGAKRGAAAHTIPDHNVDTSANAIRGPPRRLWDRETTLEFFGGIDVSTLYRGIRSGRYPRPVYVSDNVVRWLAGECEAALERMIAARGKTKPRALSRPWRRGRPSKAAVQPEAEG
jgi:predicted DNA-binding transcriptional regulator AlpA